MSTPAMPAGAVPQRPSGKPDHRSHTLTLWSLAMIPATAISVVAAVLLGNALMNATGTPEGELLISAGFAGWLAWIAVTLTMLSAPLMGVLLGLLARRPDGDSRATMALVINAAIAVALAGSAILGLLGGLFS